MENLSNLDLTSRTFMLMVLSIVCVGLVAFAFRRRGLVHNVWVAWLLGKAAGERRNMIRKQARLVSDSELTQRLGVLALACQNREGDSYSNPADLAEGIRVLQEYLDTH